MICKLTDQCDPWDMGIREASLFDRAKALFLEQPVIRNSLSSRVAFPSPSSRFSPDPRLYFILAGVTVTSCELYLFSRSVLVCVYTCLCVRGSGVSLRLCVGTAEQDVRSCAQPRGGTGNSIDGSFCSLTGDRST